MYRKYLPLSDPSLLVASFVLMVFTCKFTSYFLVVSLLVHSFISAMSQE